MNNIFDYIALTPHTTIIVDANLHFMAASKKVYAIFGLPMLIAGHKKAEMEIIFRQQKELMLKLDNLVKQLRFSGSTAVIQWQFKKKIYDLTVYPIRWEGSRYYCIDFEEVSKRYCSTSSQDLSREFLNLVINSLPVGVTVLDESGDIFAVNDTLVDLLNKLGNNVYQMQDMLGFALTDIFLDLPECSWSEMIKTASDIYPQSLQFIDRYETLVYQYTIKIFYEEASQSPSTLVVVEDITSKSEMEEQLKEVENQKTRLKTMEAIIASLKHDIFNIITPISMNAELICYCLHDDQKSEKEMTEVIVEQTHRLKEIVERYARLSDVKVINYIPNASEQILDTGDRE